MRMNRRMMVATTLMLPILCVKAQTAVDGATQMGDTISEVVVTGSSNSMRRTSLPYTISVVEGRQIEATGRTQLLSAISGIAPGLFVSQRNIFGFGVSTGGSGAIKIRGVGGSPTNAVLMMVDGQPQYAGIYSHHVADVYGTEYVDHVEVLRGPASTLYGSNAMGGVINVITKEAGKDGVRTTLSSQYGSYNTWLSSLTNAVRQGRFSSLISLGYGRTDGVEDGLDFRQCTLYAKMGYDINNAWKAKVDYQLVKSRGDDPVYPTLDDPESSDVYRQDIIRGAVSLSASNSYANGDGVLRAYYSYGNHYMDDPDHFHALDDRFGVTAVQNVALWWGASASAGFDFDIYSGKIPVSGGTAHTTGSLTTISRKNITEYSPYMTLSQSFSGDAVSLTAGIRMANSDMFGTHWMPRGGVAVRPGKGWTIRASAAKGFRNPSFRELYLYKTANPDLEPESMMNYEASVEKVFSRRLSMELTAYYSKGSDMIETVDMKNVNTGRFINKGIEVAVRGSCASNLTLRASYSYLHTSLKGLAGAPKNQYYIAADWQAMPRMLVNASLTGVGSLYVSDTVEHQDYALLNMRVSYTVAKCLSMFVDFDNITDAQYVIIRGYDMPGFTAAGGFRLRI